MLKHFHKFSPLLKRIFLFHCDDEFIRFLTECLINILEGNVSLISKARMHRFEYTVTNITTARQNHNLKLIRRLLSANRGIPLLSVIYHANHDTLCPFEWVSLVAHPFRTSFAIQTGTTAVGFTTLSGFIHRVHPGLCSQNYQRYSTSQSSYITNQAFRQSGAKTG